MFVAKLNLSISLYVNFQATAKSEANRRVPLLQHVRPQYLVPLLCERVVQLRGHHVPRHGRLAVVLILILGIRLRLEMCVAQAHG